MMKDDNEDDLKNKEDLPIAGRHMALDIFRFAVFFFFSFFSVATFSHRRSVRIKNLFSKIGSEWPIT